MSMLRLRLVRKVNRASASVFVGNMRSDWKLERSLSNIGPGPCIGVCCDRNWKNAPTSAQSDTKKGARSTRTSLVVSRTLAIGNDWAIEWPNEYATVRAIGVFGVAVAEGVTTQSSTWSPILWERDRES